MLGTLVLTNDVPPRRKRLDVITKSEQQGSIAFRQILPRTAGRRQLLQKCRRHGEALPGTVGYAPTGEHQIRIADLD
jgi:hypothetical protein